jgi:hypothetical protein
VRRSEHIEERIPARRPLSLKEVAEEHFGHSLAFLDRFKPLVRSVRGALGAMDIGGPPACRLRSECKPFAPEAATVDNQIGGKNPYQRVLNRFDFEINLAQVKDRKSSIPRSS